MYIVTCKFIAYTYVVYEVTSVSRVSITLRL